MLLCCGCTVLLRKLCPSYPRLQVVVIMAVQTAMAYAVKVVPWWKVYLAACVVSGTPSQNLCTVQHKL